ncbi:galactose oxidase-like domain-containing protein [Nocardia concava]|uniref:galactose oxidase-like domain-containing protein n=1 Tax=Nocardia concava TaxID=257281 RepID=UPI0002D300F8|nr:galactose oxidase-like domain-containing protein [Nocardia concava]
MEFTPRHIFLKIEPLADYSPLAPEICSRRYGRDCMYGMGHELGRVTPDEIRAAGLDALVFREYLDPHYTVPNTAELVPADANEPAWNRRVPGAVLYAQPGERLFIHVLNGDPDDCHSFHLHGLRYGIDSDGAWPFGIAARDGRRSDEIRPGESWTYVYEVTRETIGAWPFHDHAHNIARNVNRGLFGGLIVRDPDAPRADLEIPVFVHQMQAATKSMSFRSPSLATGQKWPNSPADKLVFDRPGTVAYHCLIHGTGMSGMIMVAAQDPNQPPATATVHIKNLSFGPPITIRVGDTVEWVNDDGVDHIVFASGGGQATYCLNGRAYVGNTPTVECDAGQRLRWYVFNLDVASTWHNFHPHASRWQLPNPPGVAADVHSLSPVESFVTDTVAPPALRLPCELERLQCDPPADACRVRVKGEFLFHCHIEDHMMAGLAGLVRSREYLWVTAEAADCLPFELPYDDGSNSCPQVDPARCESHGGMDMGDTKADSEHPAMMGAWEVLPCDSQVLAVHASLLPTGKVLFTAGSGNNVPNFKAHKFEAVVWDYENGGFKHLKTPTDVFCGGHALLPDGRLVHAGGTLAYPDASVGFLGERTTYLLDPALEDFIRVADMRDGRWYPSLITLPDGRILALSGLNSENTGINPDLEIYSYATNWCHTGTLHTPPGTGWPLYPHVFVVQRGLFYTGGHVFGSGALPPGFLDLATGALDPLAMTPAQTADFDLEHRDQSASVLLPPAQDQRLMVMGGGGGDPEVATAKVHITDLTAAQPTYTAANPMANARIHLNAVLLPDRTVLVSGGELTPENAATAALDAEIYDPATGDWRTVAKASIPRMYHSVALLLPDARVITAGSNPEAADPGGGELRLELYHPPYLFRGPRPHIADVRGHIHLGDTFEIETPQARDIKWISLIRTMSTTHSWDSNQRLVDIPFESCGFCTLRATMPADPCLVPPGFYLLFLVNSDGVPSVARIVQVAHPHAPEPHPGH